MGLRAVGSDPESAARHHTHPPGRGLTGHPSPGPKSGGPVPPSTSTGPVRPAGPPTLTQVRVTGLPSPTSWRTNLGTCVPPEKDRPRRTHTTFVDFHNPGPTPLRGPDWTYPGPRPPCSSRPTPVGPSTVGPHGPSSPTTPPTEGYNTVPNPVPETRDCRPLPKSLWTGRSGPSTDGQPGLRGGRRGWHPAEPRIPQTDVLGKESSPRRAVPLGVGLVSVTNGLGGEGACGDEDGDL